MNGRIYTSSTCAICDRGGLSVPALAELRPGRLVCSDCGAANRARWAAMTPMGRLSVCLYFFNALLFAGELAFADLAWPIALHGLGAAIIAPDALRAIRGVAR